INIPPAGIAGGVIQTLNGQNQTAQTLVAGAGIGVTSVAGVHTVSELSPPYKLSGITVITSLVAAPYVPPANVVAIKVKMIGAGGGGGGCAAAGGFSLAAGGGGGGGSYLE